MLNTHVGILFGLDGAGAGEYVYSRKCSPTRINKKLPPVWPRADAKNRYLCKF
jgi:hypothetical protein